MVFNELHECVMCGDIAGVRAIIEGPDSESLLEEGNDGDSMTPLHMSCNSGLVKIATVLIEGGANVNSTDVMSRTPLHFASLSGHIAVMELLIKNKANVNAVAQTLKTPLHEAVEGGSADATKLLLKHGAKPDAIDSDKRTPLMRAAQFGFDGVVKILIDNGANPNLKNAEGHSAIELTDSDSVRAVLAKVVSSNAAAAAASASAASKQRKTEAEEKKQELAKLEKVKDKTKKTTKHEVVATAQKVNTATEAADLAVAATIKAAAGLRDEMASGHGKQSNMTSDIHEASASGDIESIEKLLNDGIDVNLPDDVDGMTPLHITSSAGHVRSTRLLLDNGGDFSATDNLQFTPLHYAACNGHVPVIRMLLGAGANLSALAIHKRQPLQLAVEGGHDEAAKALLDSGASINATDSFLRTPLHRAIDLGLLSTVKLCVRNKASLHMATDTGLTALELIKSKISDNKDKPEFKDIEVLVMAALQAEAEPDDVNRGNDQLLARINALEAEKRALEDELQHWRPVTDMEKEEILDVEKADLKATIADLESQNKNLVKQIKDAKISAGITTTGKAGGVNPNDPAVLIKTNKELNGKIKDLEKARAALVSENEGLKWSLEKAQESEATLKAEKKNYEDEMKEGKRRSDAMGRKDGKGCGEQCIVS